MSAWRRFPFLRSALASYCYGFTAAAFVAPTSRKLPPARTLRRASSVTRPGGCGWHRLEGQSI